MRNSRLFFMLAILALLALSFSFACGDDDDDDSGGGGDDDDDNDDNNVDDDDDSNVDDDDDSSVDDDDDSSVDDDDDSSVDDDDVSPGDDDDDDNDDDDDDDDDDDTVGFATGVSFDGTSGYAYAADSATLNPVTDISVEAWVRISALPGYQYHVVDKQGAPVKGDKAPQGGYYMKIAPDGYVAFCVNCSGAANCAETTVPLSLNTWHHVVGVNDDTDSDVRIYLDGANMVNYATCGFDIDDTANELWIARHIPSSSNYDQFDVDEVRISDSVRVTGATYTVPTGPYTSDANTLALWHFNEGSSTAAADSSANGNDLTLSGGASWIDHL